MTITALSHVFRGRNGMILGGVALVALIAVLIGTQNSDVSEVAVDDATVATTTIASTTFGMQGIITANATDDVRVGDQKAGDAVVLERVSLSRPGWIAIREEIAGQPGNILGAAWFGAGVHEGVVPLLRETKPGATYNAFIFADDGDKQFNNLKDVPVTRDGLLLLMRFDTE